jgi:hypothetical protein
MSSDTLLQKFNRLDPHAQDRLLAFWDFLLVEASQPQATMSASYREHIRKVGVWAEEDLEPLEDAASRWHWPVSEW